MTNAEKLPRIVCVGDVMKEVGSLSNVIPVTGEMLVLDAGANFGGAAVNVAINLGLLGSAPELWGSVGEADCNELYSDLVEKGVDCTNLLSNRTGTDLIVALKSGQEKRSGIYIRQSNRNYAKPLAKEAFRAKDILVFCGSRHSEVRREVCSLFLAMKNRPEKPMLCFAPSYSIFDFGRDGSEVSEFVRAADVLFFNEYEATEVCKWLGKDTSNLVDDDQVLSVTLADQGALMFLRGQSFNIDKLSDQRGDVLGSGDAFVAGFLAALSNGNPFVECGWQGAALAAVIANRKEIRPSVLGSDLRDAVQQLLGSIPERLETIGKA